MIVIEPGLRSRLFEKFKQADSSGTRRCGGSGLGLTLCKQHAGLRGGDIGIESVLRQGSTFWFRIGVEIANCSDMESQSGRDLLVGTRVLVVDDNATNRSILRHHLQAWEASPTEAEDGPSALAAHRPAAGSSRVVTYLRSKSANVRPRAVWYGTPSIDSPTKIGTLLAASPFSPMKGR